MKRIHAGDTREEMQQAYREQPHVQAMRKQYASRWRLENPEKYKASIRNSYLKKFYGITTEYYENLLVDQGGGCAICNKSPEDNRKRLAVDHCHDSGIIRGLLCHDCNTGLGKFKDNTNILLAAGSYLKETPPSKF